MRIGYLPNPPQGLLPEDQEILERVTVRRGDRGLLPIDLTLFHAPKFAEGWNSLASAIRLNSSLPADLREIVICRVALINHSWYEWNAHAPILMSEGATEEIFSVIKEPFPTSRGALNHHQWIVLRYVDAMTRSVSVPQGLFDEIIEAGFDKRQIIELTGTIAAYNMVSRFLVALDVGEANDKIPEWVSNFANPSEVDGRL